MIPSDLRMSSLSAALQDVSLLYLDGYSDEMALAVAKQVSSFGVCNINPFMYHVVLSPCSLGCPIFIHLSS